MNSVSISRFIESTNMPVGHFPNNKIIAITESFRKIERLYATETLKLFSE